MAFSLRFEGSQKIDLHSHDIVDFYVTYSLELPMQSVSAIKEAIHIYIYIIYIYIFEKKIPAKLPFTRGTLCQCPELKQQYHNHLVTPLRIPNKITWFLTHGLWDLEVENKPCPTARFTRLFALPSRRPEAWGVNDYHL